MDRRAFLSLLASGVALGAPRALADPAASIRLTLRPDKLGNVIPADFTGLSYETSQLHDPDFFSAANTGLVQFVRRLGKSGVLRIGGNSSAHSIWTPNARAGDAHDDTLAAHVLSEALRPDQVQPRRSITPLALRNLRDFLDATGWRLIYGLNLGTGTADEAATEADAVTNTMGAKLIAFQVGNEPDLFYRNGLRSPDYTFDSYAEEWQRFYTAVRGRVPNAVLAGPDVADNDTWLMLFAPRFKSEAQFLTAHYYAEGPPTDPSMTIDRLLHPNPKLLQKFEAVGQVQRETGLPFRLAETNSCYHGGKQGVSDAFASALWGTELMYQLAEAGGTGINFHGGGDGWYTPIAGTPKSGFSARPLYHGMLMFDQAGPGTLIGTDLDNRAAPQVSAYALKGADGALRAVLFNKDPVRDAIVNLDAGIPAAGLRSIRLTAPSLEDTTATTLAGIPVGADASWRPANSELHNMREGKALLHLPKASAVLIRFI